MDLLRPLLLLAALIGAPQAAMAQATRDLGLPPAQTPNLPPAQNPNLPPPTGRRYEPGAAGPFANPDRPALPRRTRAARAGSDSYRSDVFASRPGVRGGDIRELAGIAPHLRGCWSPPRGFKPRSRLDVTVRFSLTRGGGLVGPPRVTYVSARATEAQRRALVGSVSAAIEACAPLPLSGPFGAAIAGRPLSIRFIVDAPDGARLSRSKRKLS